MHNADVHYAAQQLTTAQAQRKSDLLQPADTKAAQKPMSRLSLLQRRLLTKADWKHLHAASAALNLAHSLARAAQIVAAMATSLHYVPATPTEFALKTALILVKDITSVPMALQHRRGPLREAFLFAAFVSSLSWLAALFYEFSPKSAEFTVTAAPVYGAGAVLAACSAIRPFFMTAGAIVQIMRMRNGSTPAVSSSAEPDTRTAVQLQASASAAALWVLFVTVQAVPGYILMQNCLIAAFADYNHCAHVWPDIAAANFSLVLIGTLAGDLGVFSGTLRDRKVITPGQDIAVQLFTFGGFVMYFAAAVVAKGDGGPLAELLGVHRLTYFAERADMLLHGAPLLTLSAPA